MGCCATMCGSAGPGSPCSTSRGEVAFRHITVKVRPGVLIPGPRPRCSSSEVLAALPTPGPRDVAWNPEAAEQEREAVAAVKKALVEAGESVSPSENTESNETEEDVAVGGDFGRSSSAGMDETRKSLLVADLCTGSGCIACSLAYEHPDVRVIATDIASEAVALAKENAEALGLADRVAVLQCSLGSGIGEKRMGTFDAVVSNPPYVPTAVMAGIPREVADFEPTLALDGGADGLDLFQASGRLGRPGPEARRRARLRVARGPYGCGPRRGRGRRSFPTAASWTTSPVAPACL